MTGAYFIHFVVVKVCWSCVIGHLNMRQNCVIVGSRNYSQSSE